MYHFLFFFRAMFFRVKSIIVLLSSIFILSGCSNGIGIDILGSSVKIPILSLVTASPSNDGNPIFKVENLEEDGIVSIYSDPDCTQEIEIDSDSITSIGTDEISLNLFNEISGDDDYSYYAKQIKDDESSPCSSGVIYTLDTMASEPTLDLAQGTVSPSSNKTPSFMVSNVENGALVSLHTDSSCSSDSVASDTSDGDSIVLRIETDLSVDGTYTYYAKQVDRAGNISGCSSAGVDYELNTDPLLPRIELAQGTVSPSNSNTAPSFTVSNLEDGALVSLHTDSSCSSDSVASGTASGGSIVLTITLINDGIYTYYAKQVNTENNISPCSNDASYTLDRQRPVVPTLSLATSTPFNDSTPTFSLGNLEIGSSVGLYSDDSCNTLVETTSAVTEVSMEIALSTPLANYGIYSYFAKQEDGAGNASDCSNAVIYEFVNTSFNSIWRVGDSEYGDGSLSVTLPLREGYEYDFTVDWGDGSQLQAVTAYSATITHDYANAGDYTIKITDPKFPAWYFNNKGDKNKIIEVKNFGIVGWENLERAFHGCSKLTKFTAGTTDTSGVTSMYNMFRKASSLTELDLSSFNTSSVTSMSNMFREASSLTELDLSSFNTSSVITMTSMFTNVSSLISLDLSNFDVSNVTAMDSMFYDTPDLLSLDLRSWNPNNAVSKYNIFGSTNDYNNYLVIKCSATPILGKACAVSQ